MTRIAKCPCGGSTHECEGEPRFVALCHGEMGQRRTGSSYGLGAWLDRDAVATDGAEHVSVRAGEDTGASVDVHFCPDCGTSLHWEQSETPHRGILAVAVGCFTNPDFPAPSFAVSAKRRHRWLRLPPEIASFLGTTQGPREEPA